MRRRARFIRPVAFFLCCWTCPLVADQPSSPPRPSLTPLARAQARYLVVCLDGVAFDLADELHRRGELRHFHPPVPLIAPFPSLTNAGLVEILLPLGAPPARGYEDYYFDPVANKMRGGLFQRISRKSFINGTFRELFHYHPHPIAMSAEYALPVFGPWLSGHLLLSSLKENFLRSREPVFLAYISSTDPASHVSGKGLTRDLLRGLDTMVAQLRRASPLPVEVVVFSDHGNAWHTMHKVKLARALRRAGFRLRKKLQGPRDVVIPAYGLVSCDIFYTQAGEEAAAAEAVIGTRGVEFAVYRTPEYVQLLSPRGRARIYRRDAFYRYAPAEGDPLALVPIIERLQAEGHADPDDFIHEDNWLRATADHVYPDAPRRLWGAFELVVEHPASVIISLEDDYYAGSTALDLFAVLLATHGNLRRTQSLGLVLSTAGPFGLLAATDNGDEPPAALRARDFWPYLMRQRQQAWNSLRLPPRRCLTLARTSSLTRPF